MAKRGLGTLQAGTIRLLTEELRLLRVAQRESGTWQTERAASAANLSRSITALTGEVRKYAAAEAKRQATLTADERFDAVRRYLLELPKEKRAEMIALISEAG